MQTQLLAVKVALVIVSSRYIRAVIAATLARTGVKTAVHYHTSRDKAEAPVAKLRAEGLEASAFGADGRQPGELRCMAEEVIQHCGGVDILVNNLGPYCDTPFLKLPEAKAEMILWLCASPFTSVTNQTIRMDAGCTVPTWEYRIGAVEWTEVK